MEKTKTKEIYDNNNGSHIFEILTGEFEGYFIVEDNTQRQIIYTLDDIEDVWGRLIDKKDLIDGDIIEFNISQNGHKISLN